MRLRNIGLGVMLVLGISMAPLAADAQPAGKVYRIGVLFSQPLDPDTAGILEVFRKGLSDLGWVEGKNVYIEFRSAEGKVEQLPALAAELVFLKVDVLVAGALPPSLAAKRATTTIPIVSVYTLDPVGMGLVASLARPGGNITGVSAVSLDYAGKLLGLLKEAIPRASRLAVLGDVGNPSYPVYWRELEVVARTLGVTLQAIEVQRREELEKAFSTITDRRRSDGLVVIHQPFTFVNRKLIADFAIHHRLPAIFGAKEGAESGGLLGYGTSPVDAWRRAPYYVDKILKGAKPADLPVEQLTKFEFVINLKTAKALGLTIPQSVLIRADHVIQ